MHKTGAWDWRRDQRFSLITTPTDTDGHGQSRGSNPLDSTQWVSHEPSHGHRRQQLGEKSLREIARAYRLEFKVCGDK